MCKDKVASLRSTIDVYGVHLLVPGIHKTPAAPYKQLNYPLAAVRRDRPHASGAGCEPNCLRSVIADLLKVHIIQRLLQHF